MAGKAFSLTCFSNHRECNHFAVHQCIQGILSEFQEINRIWGKSRSTTALVKSKRCFEYLLFRKMLAFAHDSKIRSLHKYLRLLQKDAVEHCRA